MEANQWGDMHFEADQMSAIASAGGIPKLQSEGKVIMVANEDQSSFACCEIEIETKREHARIQGEIDYMIDLIDLFDSLN